MAVYAQSDKQIPVFGCRCKSKKSHVLKFDGGSTGFYELQLCDGCYQKEDKGFLISEETI